MVTSVFPSVTVTQIRPLQAINKPLPNMPVGIIGPRFKRIIEEKVNGYFINPETVPSVAVGLTGPADGEYIDFDSVSVQLRLASTGELVQLTGTDNEIIGSMSLIQSGINLTSPIGFYQEISTGSDWVFLPTLLAAQTYGAVIGDYLKMPSGIITKINQVTPLRFSDNNFVITAGNNSTGVFNMTGLPSGEGDNYYQYKWLVAVDKNNPKIIYQYQIASSDENTTDTITVTDATPNALSELLAVSTAITVGAYNWYVYDLPIGSLKTYAPAGTTTEIGSYSIYNYNLRISPPTGQGTVIGKMGAGTTGKYYFVPDSKALTSYFGVQEGHVLRAILRSNTTVSYDLRIKTVGSLRGYQMSTTPTHASGAYTFGTEDLAAQYTAGQWLVAISKTNPLVSASYYITSISGASNSVANISTTIWNGGAGEIVTAYDSYDWYLYSAPVGSLELEGGANFSALTVTTTTPSTFDFSVVNTSDFYISGKQEVTVLNYLADSLGEPIGLADVLVDYRVLVTADANQLWDITDETLRLAKCGDTYLDSLNPLGLASGLVEINTTFAYKVIPTDIATTEKDPDAPKSYSGKYTSENDTYHNVNNLDWTGAKEVLESTKDTQIPYYICPLSKDESIMSMFSNTVLALSEPNKMKEMIAFLTTSIPSRETILSNINPSEGDFSVVSGRLRYHPSTKYVSGTEPLVPIDFLGIGAKKGNYITYFNATSEEEVLLQIVNIFPTYFDLGVVAFTYADLDNTKKISIAKIYQNKAEIAEALSKKAAKYGTFRVKLLWGDYVNISIGTDTYTSVPMYFGAVAYAAMATTVGTTLPKTNRSIAGITRVYNVSPYFNDDLLEIIGSGFLDILTQDYDGGPVYSKRQFMTDGSELSGVEPVDKLAKYVRAVFRPHLGKNNITPALFDVLGLVLAGVVDIFVPSEFTSLLITQPLTVSGANKDRLSLKFKPTTYKPFNGLDVTIEVQ